MEVFFIRTDWEGGQLEWDQLLSWQAKVTDEIDREQGEIIAYKAIEKVLLVRRDEARQLNRLFEVSEIDSYLASINLLVKLKQVMIKQWEAQFQSVVQRISS